MKGQNKAQQLVQNVKSGHKKGGPFSLLLFFFFRMGLHENTVNLIMTKNEKTKRKCWLQNFYSYNYRTRQTSWLAWDQRTTIQRAYQEQWPSLPQCSPTWKPHPPNCYAGASASQLAPHYCVSGRIGRKRLVRIRTSRCPCRCRRGRPRIPTPRTRDLRPDRARREAGNGPRSGHAGDGPPERVGC